jgi:hypothetical protein
VCSSRFGVGLSDGRAVGRVVGALVGPFVGRLVGLSVAGSLVGPSIKELLVSGLVGPHCRVIEVAWTIRRASLQKIRRSSCQPLELSLVNPVCP